MIGKKYPGVFVLEWIYGGKKHGWTVRYKKNRSFCTLIPEKNRRLLFLIFGREDRVKVELIRRGLSARVLKAYDEATTYTDGKWLLMDIDNKTAINDAQMLPAVKRKPKA